MKWNEGSQGDRLMLLLLLMSLLVNFSLPYATIFAIDLLTLFEMHLSLKEQNKYLSNPQKNEILLFRPSN